MRTILQSLFAVILLFSCDKTIIEPAGPVLIPDELRRGITIGYRGLDSLLVTGNIDLEMEEKWIKSVALGDLSDGYFDFKQAFAPTYSGQPGSYNISFELFKRLRGDEMDDHFAVRFYMQNDVFTQVEFNEPVHLHPYPSMRVFFENNAIPGYPENILGLQKDGNIFFFSGTLPGSTSRFALYKFDQNVRSTELLFENFYHWMWDIYKNPGSGETEIWLTAGGREITQYNTTNPVTSLGTITISNHNFRDVLAIDVHENYFYAILADCYPCRRFQFCKIDFTGQVVESEEFPVYSRRIEVHNDRIFSISGSQYFSYFHVVDRTSGTIITEALAPAIGTRDFDIADGRFYYSDILRNHIASIDLREFD